MITLQGVIVWFVTNSIIIWYVAMGLLLDPPLPREPWTYIEHFERTGFLPLIESVEPT